MDRKEIRKSLAAIEVEKTKLDDHIWDVFNAYIDQEGINFSGPESWEYDGEDIIFKGEDGCMGCYDSMSLCIPIKFFEDANALKDLKKQRELEEKKLKDQRAAAKRAYDKAEYERLKKEFG